MNKKIDEDDNDDGGVMLDEDGEDCVREDQEQEVEEVKHEIKKLNIQHVVAQQSLLAQSFPGLLSPKHDRAVELQKKDKDFGNNNNNNKNALGASHSRSSKMQQQRSVMGK